MPGRLGRGGVGAWLGPWAAAAALLGPWDGPASQRPPSSDGVKKFFFFFTIFSAFSSRLLLLKPLTQCHAQSALHPGAARAAWAAKGSVSKHPF